jgi:ADP-ribose pyrophosphatase
MTKMTAPPKDSEKKPNSRAYGWERFETRYPYTYRMFRIREDRVRWPDGHVAPYTYVQGTGAVWIVPVTAEDQVILIRQFRYTLDEWSWEVPAGGFHDFTGTPLELAQRELEEEVGGSSEDWLYVGPFRPGVSLFDEICHIVLARDVRLDREPQREPGEIIEIHPTPVERALEMVHSGEMIDGHSALALLRCVPFLE